MRLPVKYSSPFSIGDRVTIDGDRDLKARVIGVLFRYGGVQIEVAWLHNGDAKTSWIELFRLEAAEDDK